MMPAARFLVRIKCAGHIARRAAPGLVSALPVRRLSPSGTAPLPSASLVWACWKPSTCLIYLILRPVSLMKSIRHCRLHFRITEIEAEVTCIKSNRLACPPQGLW